MLIYIAAVVVTVIALSAYILHSSLDKKVVYKTLEKKHVVITGGSSGIGKATAIEAARLGANVTIIGRDVDKLKSAAKEILSQCKDTNEQKIQYSALDVTANYEVISKSLSSLEADIGPIFMLINCAGSCICGQFENMKVEDIKMLVDLNYYGTAFPTKYVLTGMKERNEGLIVFVSSEAAFIGIYGYSAYSAAKWAVRGLAEALIMELVGTGVRLTISFPPDTATPGFEKEEVTKPNETKLISGTGGLHSPDDIGKKIVHDALSLLLVCVVACGHAAGLLAPVAYGGAWNPYSAYPSQPAIATQHSNILRSPFNLGQVSTYSKAIDTPFSSVRKSDIRVSNPGLAVGAAYGGYAAPYVSHVGVAAPFAAPYAAPFAAPYSAPVAKVATAGGLLGVAYSAAPAVSHMTYTNGLGLAYAW